MKTFYRTLREDIKDPDGNLILSKGARVLTSDTITPHSRRRRLGGREVMVFSQYWFCLPLDAFENDPEPFTTT